MIPVNSRIPGIRDSPGKSGMTGMTGIPVIPGAGPALKCNICGMDHEVDFGISSTDPSVTYQPIEELIAAYEELE